MAVVRRRPCSSRLRLIRCWMVYCGGRYVNVRHGNTPFRAQSKDRFEIVTVFSGEEASYKGIESFAAKAIAVRCRREHPLSRNGRPAGKVIPLASFAGALLVGTSTSDSLHFAAVARDQGPATGRVRHPPFLHVCIKCDRHLGSDCRRRISLMAWMIRCSLRSHASTE